jgi:uncharacterized zinc-type alcohol dehydrogenase-like protein
MLVHAMAAMHRGAALTPWQYETPQLGPYDCILQVKACGLCHSDIHVIDGAFEPTYPVVPGHEVVGEVIEKGAMVRHLKIGDRVGVGWQRSSCLGCRDCLAGHENLCAKKQAVITNGYGGFGDYLFMDSGFCFPLPAGIATVAAGPLLCGGVTVYSGLRNAGMSSGQEIGVLGVGGLGHLAIQFAARLGNRVTAFTTSPDKADLAVRLGAHAAVVTGRERPAVPRPLDILVSTVPAKLDWNAYLELLGANGTMVFLAIMTEPLSLNPLLLLTNQRRVMGSVIGGRSTILETLDIADRFGVTPVIETFPLSEVNTAISKMRDNTIRFRAVLLM